jgi:N-acetylglutamate synthase-like GNAT family acetyltransferase
METCAYCDARPFFRDPESGACLCPTHAWLEVTGPRLDSPRPPITIRPAVSGDRPQISALTEYFRRDFDVLRCCQPPEANALPAYVACDDDTIVGVASYDCAGGVLDLRALNVQPQWRGRGVATLLINAVIQEARAQGATRVFASVTNDNLPGLGLFQRLGFTITGVLLGRLAQAHGAESGFDGILVRDEIQLELGLDE